MALKYKYSNLKEIPTEDVRLYVERGGEWILDAESEISKAKFEEFRQNNIAFTQQLKRFEGIDPDAVRQLAAAGLVVGVNPNPIMPGITDSERSLDRLAHASRDAGAVTFGGGPLFLMPSAQAVFFPFLEREFPELLPRYKELYARSAYLGREYKAELAARVRRIRERYGLDSGMVEYKPEIQVEEQGELFA